MPKYLSDYERLERFRKEYNSLYSQTQVLITQSQVLMNNINQNPYDKQTQKIYDKLIKQIERNKVKLKTLNFRFSNLVKKVYV